MLKKHKSCISYCLQNSYNAFILYLYLYLSFLNLYVLIYIDIVPIAIDECLKRLETLSTTELPLDSKANCDFQVRNFFEIAETFNFVYDYTFFCALSPAIRDQWARKMADLVVPGGLLMTLIFPIRPGDDGVKGPPHAVSSVEVFWLIVYNFCIASIFIRNY